ncbi:MAG: SCP2 sterol-binding domain-containing protein [Candidatus Jordarchaeum sp.]|uniref:SCP2 sterol-binding domain-containing protein n=1 Tax=Candidatus Jordarchaeum sp. TaxID=2823881 RepID=UPI00404A7820
MVVEGVTGDVVKEIVDVMSVVFNSQNQDFKDKIKSVTGGLRRVYRFEVTDLGLSCDVELTPKGEVVIHWDVLPEEPNLRVSSETLVFDGVMTQRVNPMKVMLLRKVKLKGSLKEVAKFRPILPLLSPSYKKARVHIAEKYGLQEALKKMDEAKI